MIVVSGNSFSLINKVGNVGQCHWKEPLLCLKLKKMNTVGVLTNLSSGRQFCKTL